MKNIFKLTLLVVMVLTSCNGNPEFILLPYHSDTTRMSYSYLVSNPPEDIDSLDKLLIDFTAKQIETKQIDYIRFCVKNYTTSYFIDNADDPGGAFSEELSDYYTGSKKPMSGLGSIGRWPCDNDSSKYIYILICLWTMNNNE